MTMDERMNSGPMVIRYPNEEYTSYDEVFLKVSNIVTRFSKRYRRKGPGGQMRKVKRNSYVDIYYA